MAKVEAADQEILEHHLLYEFAMLQGTYVGLAKGGHIDVIGNALIESFCIHARLLVEFFTNKQGRKAQEFTGGTYAAAHLSSLGVVATKLNTQLAHLTGQRTVDVTKKISLTDRQKLLTALEREAQYFSDNLAPPFQGLFTPPTAIM